MKERYHGFIVTNDDRVYYWGTHLGNSREEVKKLLEQQNKHTLDKQAVYVLEDRRYAVDLLHHPSIEQRDDVVMELDNEHPQIMYGMK